MSDTSIWQEAGPEWVYVARLARKGNIRIEFDSLLVNLHVEGDEPVTKIDSIQNLRKKQEGMYVASDLTRFSFLNLREMIGPNSGDFDLFFVAYKGEEPGVAILDPPSFRRLLSAISYLGLPIAAPVARATEVPPVLRFSARPKDEQEAFPVEIYEPRIPVVPSRSRSISRRGRRTRPPSPRVTEPYQMPSHLPLNTQRDYAPREPQEDTPRPQDIPIWQGDSRAQGDTPMEYGDLPSFPTEYDEGQRPSLKSLMSLDESELHSEARDSFLEVPKEPRREPLTFEARVEEDLGYGLSTQEEDVHQEHIHNLYADISGQDRNKRDPENPDHEYQPPYSTVRLPPYQTYPTAFILSQGDKILHYLADRPGLGKTFSALEACCRLTFLLSIEITIERERQNLQFLQTRPLHVHKRAHHRFGINQTCRADTLLKWGIICPCSSESPTFNVTEPGNFHPGFMLFLVPLQLVDQWVKEIKRFLRSDARLPHNQKPIEVLNVHEGTDYGEKLKNFILSKPEHYGLGTFLIVPTTSTVTKSLLSLRKEPNPVLQTSPAMICIDEVQNLGSTTHDSVEWVRELISYAHYPTHVLALGGTPWRNGPADFDVIEKIALDAQSWAGWWGQEAYDDYVQRLKNARARLNESAKQVRQMDIIGRGKQGDIQDEEKREAHGMLAWHDQNLRQYAAEIPLLQRKEEGMYLGFNIPKFSGNVEVELIRCDSELNDAQKLVANGYKEFLRVCHRKRVRDWSKKPESTRGPRPKIRDLLFTLENLSNASSRIDVSLIGFAPGMTQAVLDGNAPGVQFRSEEANELFKGTTTITQRQVVRGSKYWDMAQTVFHKVDTTGRTVLHPKVEFICDTIDEMLKDNEPHVKGTTYLGVFPKKMIIVVPHAFQGLLLSCYLHRRYPTKRFTFVGARSENNRERPALLAPFSRPTTVPSPEDGQSSDPIALISTYGLIGTGLNLIRCNYLIITSPLSSKAYEKQQVGRIDRRGQYATKLHAYMLVDNGNPVDVTTFHRFQQRTAVTVPPDEIGSGLDFLLQDIDEEDSREPDIDDEMGE